MSEWQKYLTDQQIREVRQAVIEAGLNDTSTLDVIAKGLHPLYRGNLSDAPSPNTRIHSVLHEMNTVHNLRNGDVPLTQWLSAAIDLAGDLPQVDVLENALQSIQVEPGAPLASAQPVVAANDIHVDVRPEAQIAGADATLSVDYLKAGIATASSVVKLLVHRHIAGEAEFMSGDLPVLSNATGWIIAPGMLVTNHHVINARRSLFGEADATDADFTLQAENTSILYDYLKLDKPSVQLQSGVGALLASDQALDFALLRLPETAPGRPPLRLRKRAIKKRKEQALGTRVNLLQHPNGKPMRLGFRDNFVVLGSDTSLSYLTDTRSGSSGSPVCDDSWSVAALHSGSRSIGNLQIEIRGRRVKRENYGTPVPSLMKHLEVNHTDLHAEILEGQAAL